ncbi:MAG: hypothetical protein K0S27_1309 [Gammaproteobacteria bacterium]|jgi:hypothetical protein|nr:hypothetical protein [Gammaproteobacteria bacterium]
MALACGQQNNMLDVIRKLTLLERLQFKLFGYFVTLHII